MKSNEASRHSHSHDGRAQVTSLLPICPLLSKQRMVPFFEKGYYELNRGTMSSLMPCLAYVVVRSFMFLLPSCWMHLTLLMQLLTFWPSPPARSKHPFPVKIEANLRVSLLNHTMAGYAVLKVVWAHDGNVDSVQKLVLYRLCHTSKLVANVQYLHSEKNGGEKKIALLRGRWCMP